MDRLDAIFSPKALAVVGASTTPGKVGHDIFVNILNGSFTGTLYPVNPKARSVACVKAYPTLTDIPDDIDLAMIILPPHLALKATKDAIDKGVKGIVIVSAGFREVGGEGLEIENKIVALCTDAGVRMIGPNCLGVINPNPDIRLNASFSARMPESGNVSFISQSGALCTAVLDFAADREFGFSKFISIGNKADVDELDLLRYLHADQETEVIMIYLEELRHGAEFVNTVKEITSGDSPKPVLVIKSGRTGAVQRPQHPTQGPWPGRKPFMTPSFSNPESFASKVSMNCSILQRPLPIKTRAPWVSFDEKCPMATVWPSSPMPAVQVSSPRMSRSPRDFSCHNWVKTPWMHSPVICLRLPTSTTLWTSLVMPHRTAMKMRCQLSSGMRMSMAPW